MKCRHCGYGEQDVHGNCANCGRAWGTAADGDGHASAEQLDHLRERVLAIALEETEKEGGPSSLQSLQDVIAKEITQELHVGIAAAEVAEIIRAALESVALMLSGQSQSAPSATGPDYCAVCGKPMAVPERKCPECGEVVCEEHFLMEKLRCTRCDDPKLSEYPDPSGLAATCPDCEREHLCLTHRHGQVGERVSCIADTELVCEEKQRQCGKRTPERSRTSHSAARAQRPSAPSVSHAEREPSSSSEDVDAARRGAILNRYIDLIFTLPATRWTVHMHYPSILEEITGFVLDLLESSGFIRIRDGYFGRTYIVFWAKDDEGMAIEVRRSHCHSSTGYYLGESFDYDFSHHSALEKAFCHVLRDMKQEHDARLREGKGSRRDRIIGRLLEEVLAPWDQVAAQ